MCQFRTAVPALLPRFTNTIRDELVTPARDRIEHCTDLIGSTVPELAQRGGIDGQTAVVYERGIGFHQGDHPVYLFVR